MQQYENKQEDNTSFQVVSKFRQQVKAPLIGGMSAFIVAGIMGTAIWELIRAINKDLVGQSILLGVSCGIFIFAILAHTLTEAINERQWGTIIGTELRTYRYPTKQQDKREQNEKIYHTLLTEEQKEEDKEQKQKEKRALEAKYRKKCQHFLGKFNLRITTLMDGDIGKIQVMKGSEEFFYTDDQKNKKTVDLYFRPTQQCIATIEDKEITVHMNEG